MNETVSLIICILSFVLALVSVITVIVSLKQNAKQIKAQVRLGCWAAVALTLMMIGAIGTGIAPPQYFGIVERCSVFAATGYNAVLGWYLFKGFGQSNGCIYD